MSPTEPPNDKAMLKTILGPLLDDFLFWFGRSLAALEKEQVSFMSVAEQQDLMARIRSAQSEVSTAKLMFEATDGGAGVDMAVVAPWHKLVAECWGVAQKNRQVKNQLKNQQQDGSV